MTTLRAAAPPVPVRALAVASKVAAATAIAVGLGVAAATHYKWGAVGADFNVFHGAATEVIRGGSPYDFNDNGFMFIYSPFAAMILFPLGLLSVNAAFGVWTSISVLLLEVVIWQVLGAIGTLSRQRRATWLLVTTVAVLPLAPVLAHLALGQSNLALLFLVLGDLIRRSGRTRGVGVGIAAGVKLTALIFIPYLLVTRQFRTAAVVTATFAGTVLVGFAVLPAASLGYWRGAFADTTRMLPNGAGSFNASLLGLFTPPPQYQVNNPLLWLSICAVVGIAGLAIAAWASRRGDELVGVLACAITGLLISPITWPPHWVWCVPLLIVAARYAWRADATGAKLAVGLLWLALILPSYWFVLQAFGRLSLSGPGLLLFSKYPILLGFLSLSGIAWLLWRQDRRVPVAERAADVGTTPVPRVPREVTS
jgi:alpha-1,2-mannosyltransferase